MSTNNSLTASLGRVVPAFSKGITDNSVVNFLLQEANNQNLSKEQQRFFWHILIYLMKISMIRCMFGSGEEGGLKEGGIVNNSRSPSCWHLNPSEVLTVLDHLALWGPSGPSKVTLIPFIKSLKNLSSDISWPSLAALTYGLTCSVVVVFQPSLPGPLL